MRGLTAIEVEVLEIAALPPPTEDDSADGWSQEMLAASTRLARRGLILNVIDDVIGEYDVITASGRRALAIHKALTSWEIGI